MPDKFSIKVAVVHFRNSIFGVMENSRFVGKMTNKIQI